MTNRTAFQANLTRLIEKRNCAQIDLARYCDCAKGTVSAWMNGRGYPRADMMEKIAKFFNVSVFELVCYDDNDEEKMLRTFRVLSPKGKEKALERMEELKQLYWYAKEDVKAL